MIRYRAHVTAVLVVFLCALGGTSCASRPASPVPTTGLSAPRYDLSPEVALASDPAVMIRSYFGPDARLADTAVRDKFRRVTLTPFVFWRVETETTPSAGAICATLLSMGQRYGGHGRSIDLRVDWGGTTGRSDPVRTSAFFWNPTAVPSIGWGYGMSPGPHSIGVWTGRGGMSPRDVVTLTVRNVTASQLASAAVGDGPVYEALSQRTPFR